LAALGRSAFVPPLGVINGQDDAVHLAIAPELVIRDSTAPPSALG
jgi:hypothetical protein